MLRPALDRVQHRRPRSDESLRPEVEGLIEQLRASAGGNQFETFATKTESFLEAVVDGHCDLRPGIRKVTATGVVFTDDTSVDVDTIVLCTGFQKASAPFLDAPEGLDRLYRSVFDPRYSRSGPPTRFVRHGVGR